MENELKPLSPFQDFCVKFLGYIPSTYDECYTYLECLIYTYNYLKNEIVPSVNAQNEVVQELKDYVEHYFDNLDVQEEINNKLDQMAEDGTLEDLIKKYILKLPRGNSMELQRIGRKIIFGENPTAYNYDSDGVACTIQGGCVINSNTIAYALWDSLNADLNKNKIVIMNLSTGTVQREENFTFGWCNSLAYDSTNEKIYVAVRGTTTSGTSTNNGIIKVIDPSTLTVDETIELDVNVNAISIYDDTLYVLEENTNNILLYGLDGIYLEQSIALDVDIDNLYNQDIKVDDEYIYVISTKPNNLLNVYDHDGNHLETYDIKKYGGIYYVGELQFIDGLENNDMLLGSVVTNYNEFNNQFFKFNLINNISVADVLTKTAQTFYCDSTANNYNPDGTSTNPFTTINEVDNINIKSIVCQCQNKEYKYTYIANHDTFRIHNAILNEGLYAQYGNYTVLNSTLKRCLDTSIEACTFFRYTNMFFDTDTFDATNEKYCFYPTGSNVVKFINPTFSNYSVEACKTNAIGSIITANSFANLPYIPAINGEYNLFDSGYMDQYKIGSYDYNSSRTSDEVSKIMSKCNHVVIGYVALNTACIKEVTLEKTNSNDYTLVDTTVSSSAFNTRIAKMIFSLTSSKVNVTASNVTKIISNDGTTATFTVTQAADSTNAQDFIQLRYVKYKN